MAGFLTKIERPPYVHNFVRYVHDDVIATAKALVRFALDTPQITYAGGNAIVRDRILLGLNRETALKAALEHGHVKSRPYVLEYVTAYYEYDERLDRSRKLSFDQIVEPFRVSREIVVPVKPLAVTLEDGRFNAQFSVGWATMPLTTSQWRLLMTMIEDAVFTLTDFEKAEGYFYAFPRARKTDPKSREPLIAKRGDFELLSKVALKEKLEIYLEALALAKKMLADMKIEPKRRPDKPAGDPDQLPLFPQP